MLLCKCWSGGYAVENVGGWAGGRKRSNGSSEKSLLQLKISFPSHSPQLSEYQILSHTPMSINIQIAKTAFKIMKILRVPQPRRSILYIMGPYSPFSYHFPGVKRMKVPNHYYSSIRSKLRQRCCHMPLQYVLREWPFRRLKLEMRPPVFIPRPETSHMVEILKDTMFVTEQHFVNFVDLCCGSGAIGLSLAKECNLDGTMVDLNPAAVEVTRRNKEKNAITQHIELIQGRIEDFVENTTQKYDIVISNPPYVKDSVVAALDRQVKCYESHLALKGGEDGLDYVRFLLLNYQKILKPGGILMIEYGGEVLSGALSQFQKHVLLDQYESRRYILISKSSI